MEHDQMRETLRRTVQTQEITLTAAVHDAGMLLSEFRGNSRAREILEGIIENLKYVRDDCRLVMKAVQDYPEEEKI